MVKRPSALVVVPTLEPATFTDAPVNGALLLASTTRPLTVCAVAAMETNKKVAVNKLAVIFLIVMRFGGKMCFQFDYHSNLTLISHKDSDARKNNCMMIVLCDK